MVIPNDERFALIEALQYVKSSFQHETDDESIRFVRNVDHLIGKLNLTMGCSLTLGEVRNSCLFLRLFIEDAPEHVNTEPHRLLLCRLMDSLL